jgi:hypothetical protein
MLSFSFAAGLFFESIVFDQIHGNRLINTNKQIEILLKSAMSLNNFEMNEKPENQYKPDRSERQWSQSFVLYVVRRQRKKARKLEQCMAIMS